MRLKGKPNTKQAEFFRSTAKFTAYGGARGGGKSWALRRKLILLCLRYPGIHTLIIRRTLKDLTDNHVLPLLSEIGKSVSYSAGARVFRFKNGSRIDLGYLACDSDTSHYQGQEYDIIAVDEATQISEYQFSALKGCLRGVGSYPRRMYLTCNPGGIGHAWVKRLFIDRDFKEDENPDEYRFIRASVFDNNVLCQNDPEYVSMLKTLPEKLRAAWLDGRWDLYEGQFFPEFSREKHVILPSSLDAQRYFAAFDYGFDRFALLIIAVKNDTLYVTREYCESGLTLTKAGEALAKIVGEEKSRGHVITYAVASPDLWNRRQDTGYSGVEIISRIDGTVPLIKADNRRIPGWRALREKLLGKLFIFRGCDELIRCMEAIQFDKNVPEDAAGEPHSVTHAPEALRYAVMSRFDSDVTVTRSRDSGLINY